MMALPSHSASAGLGLDGRGEMHTAAGERLVAIDYTQELQHAAYEEASTRPILECLAGSHNEGIVAPSLKEAARSCLTTSADGLQRRTVVLVHG